MCAGRWHVASRAHTATWNPAPPKERAPAALEGVGVRLAGVMSLGAELNHSPGQGRRLPFPAGPDPAFTAQSCLPCPVRFHWKCRLAATM